MLDILLCCSPRNKHELCSRILWGLMPKNALEVSTNTAPKVLSGTWKTRGERGCGCSLFLLASLTRGVGWAPLKDAGINILTSTQEVLSTKVTLSPKQGGSLTKADCLLSTGCSCRLNPTTLVESRRRKCMHDDTISACSFRQRNI